MQVTKIEAGEYLVVKDAIDYRISKNSYTGSWSVYQDDKVLIHKNTKKECLEFIDKGHSIKLFDSISVVPPVELDSQFHTKVSPDTRWSVADVYYSTRKGRWMIRGSYYNDSIDSGSSDWSYDDFEDECELVADGCGRRV